MNGMITSLLIRMSSLDGLVQTVAIEMPISLISHKNKVTDGKNEKRDDEIQKLVKGIGANYLLNEQDRKS